MPRAANWREWMDRTFRRVPEWPHVEMGNDADSFSVRLQVWRTGREEVYLVDYRTLEGAMYDSPRPVRAVYEGVRGWLRSCRLAGLVRLAGPTQAVSADAINFGDFIALTPPPRQRPANPTVSGAAYALTQAQMNAQADQMNRMFRDVYTGPPSMGMRSAGTLGYRGQMRAAQQLAASLPPPSAHYSAPIPVPTEWVISDMAMGEGPVASHMPPLTAAQGFTYAASAAPEAGTGPAPRSPPVAPSPPPGSPRRSE